MEKTSKQLIFERMGISSPKFTMQQPVAEEGEGKYVPRADSMNRILQIFDQEGYFPIWNNGKYNFVETEKYPEEYEKFRQAFSLGWETVSLPF